VLGDWDLVYCSTAKKLTIFTANPYNFDLVLRISLPHPKMKILVHDQRTMLICSHVYLYEIILDFFLIRRIVVFSNFGLRKESGKEVGEK